MRQLAPSLTVIESNLFDPSPLLLQRWLEDASTLSAERRNALAADARAQSLADAWREPEPADAPPIPTVQRADREVRLPPHLAELIDARLALAARQLSTRPRPGLILRIDQPRGPTGPLDCDLNQPLAVLLAEPAGHPDLWSGWLMAAEIDYATDADLLLEADDAPYDPSIAMVQVWNPAQVYCPAASAALGALSPDRLAAVRDLAVDFLTAPPAPTAAEPGILVQRTTGGGHLVLTGTPLGDAQDPRWRYRELYFEAADFVRDLARQAQTELAARPGWLERVRDAVRAAVTQAQQGLLPQGGTVPGWELQQAVPTMAAPLAMETQSPGRLDTPVAPDSETWCLKDRLELRLIPGLEGGAVRIHATLKGTESVTVALESDGQVWQMQRLDPASPSTVPALFAGPEDGLTLRIRDAGGHGLLEVPLPAAEPAEFGADRPGND
jgi:hypothetical protein